MTPTMAASIYAAAGGAFLLVVAGMKPKWAQDKGGYKDTFKTFWKPPYDKLQHLLIAAALTVGAMVLGCTATSAVSITIALGILWEFVEGWPSWRDVVADAIGSLLAALLLLLIV